MKKFRILKIVGLVILTVIALVLVSIGEVAVYSYLINPGQDIAVYDAHAMESAPWISCIFGFLVFFFVVRFWCKKKYDGLFMLALLFPLTYIALDIIMLTSFGVVWAEFYGIFLIANGAKLLGALSAYFIFKPKE